MAVCGLKRSHTVEKRAQKRTAMHSGLMEGVTQELAFAVSVESEGERRRGASSMDGGGVSNTLRVPLLVPRRASGDLK